MYLGVGVDTSGFRGSVIVDISVTLLKMTLLTYQSPFINYEYIQLLIAKGVMVMSHPFKATTHAI